MPKQRTDKSYFYAAKPAPATPYLGSRDAPIYIASDSEEERELYREIDFLHQTLRKKWKRLNDIKIRRAVREERRRIRRETRVYLPRLEELTRAQEQTRMNVSQLLNGDDATGYDYEFPPASVVLEELCQVNPQGDLKSPKV